MNSRSSIKGSQKAGQKKRQGKRGIDPVAISDDLVSKVIKVEAPSARPQKTSIEDVLAQILEQQ
jgi:hypothetical protein